MNTEVDNQQIKSPLATWVFKLAVGLTVIVNLVYISIYSAVPTFEDMFDTFGAELPVSILFIFKAYHLFLLFAVLGDIPCVVLANNRKEYFKWQQLTMSFVVGNFLLSLLLVGITINILYQPIL